MTTNLASVEGATPGSSAARGPALHAVQTGLATASSRINDSPSWHEAHINDDATPEGVLTRSGFLRMVRREKRRTDRSHSALSLALIDIGDVRPGARDAALAMIGALVRETDYVAPIDDDAVAVLLPDTGEAGLRKFLDKVSGALLARAAPTVGATYPGDAFDRLVAERMCTVRSRHSAGESSPVTAAVGYPFKRGLDVVGSIVALILLSPLMLVVALTIKLSSPGPVIFRQQRIGQGGVPFTFYKFRSMRTDSDDRVHREFVASLIDGKAVAQADSAATNGYKMNADARVTAIGRLIRKTSIDELPQFYNVLVGDMSLVGPRPPVPYEAERYKGWHRRRVFELKPGLTGIWQVEGRSRVSFDDMVRMDLRYLSKCSLAFDLVILIKTVSVVLLFKGAL
jgi:lipopolysaccharide/colanic/teichoic acid biosynthesis glycosyltransferase